MTAAVKGHFAVNTDNNTELQQVAPAEAAADVAVYAVWRSTFPRPATSMSSTPRTASRDHPL